MRRYARRITALAAGCSFALTQGCLSYRASPRPLKIDDRIRVASATPLALEVAPSTLAPGGACLASEVRGTLISAHADTLVLTAPLRILPAPAQRECGSPQTVTLVVPAGADVGIQHVEPGRTLLLGSGVALLGFVGFMIFAIATDPS